MLKALFFIALVGVLCFEGLGVNLSTQNYVLLSFRIRPLLQYAQAMSRPEPKDPIYKGVRHGK